MFRQLLALTIVVCTLLVGRAAPAADHCRRVPIGFPRTPSSSWTLLSLANCWIPCWTIA